MKTEFVREPKSFPPLGHKRWVIAEGRLADTNPADAGSGQEGARVLNVSDQEARVEVTIFFSDRDPAGSYGVTVPPRRMVSIQFNDLTVPEPVPREVEFGCVVESDVPVVVYYTRRDSRPAGHGTIATIAYPDTESVITP